ncbi:MAG: SPFH/Band 7/PHB domain protein [Anaerolineales bacterium]|nr:MAG: SPFH/Band 7/PHB domain protein [Anaerolineales bacterium]
MNNDYDFEPEIEEDSGKRKAIKKRLVVALVLLGIVALSFKIHWIAGYVLLITGLLFLIFYLPSPKLRRLLITLYLVFVITVLTGTGLQMFLATNKTVGRLVEENKVVNFLIGGLTEQIILSTVLGLITGVSVVGVPLLAVTLVSSEYILALHEVHGIRRKDALRVLWSLIMGINYPWMIIEDGKATQSKPKGILSVIGGPGLAVIRAGNAVVFQRAGKISQIVGSGLVLLKQYERIRAIFDLRPQSETRETENVLTKDRIPLTITMKVGSQIEPKDATDQRPESFVEPHGEALSEVIGTLYKTYRATLEKAVYHVPASGWGVIAPGSGQNLLRDIIATYNFDEIFKRVGEVEGEPGGFDPDQRTIKEIENKIRERLSAAAPEWGAQIQGVDIREIKIREGVLEKLLDWWGAEWKKRIAIKEAEGEGEALIAKAEAQKVAFLKKAEAEARAITALEGVKYEVREKILKQVAHLGAINANVALRFINIVEQLSRDMTADDVAARRYIEVLEAIAKSDGQKTIVIGGDRRLLWPRRRIGGALEEPGDKVPDDEGQSQ